MLVEKHKTLSSTGGVIFCTQVDESTNEEIQAGLTDRFVSKAYLLHTT